MHKATPVKSSSIILHKSYIRYYNYEGNEIDMLLYEEQNLFPRNASGVHVLIPTSLCFYISILRQKYTFVGITTCQSNGSMTCVTCQWGHYNTQPCANKHNREGQH